MDTDIRYLSTLKFWKLIITTVSSTIAHGINSLKVYVHTIKGEQMKNLLISLNIFQVDFLTISYSLKNTGEFRIEPEGYQTIYFQYTMMGLDEYEVIF